MHQPPLRVGLSPSEARRVAATGFPLDDLPDYEKGRVPVNALVAVLTTYQAEEARRRPFALSRPDRPALHGTIDEMWGQAQVACGDRATHYEEMRAYGREMEAHKIRERLERRKLVFPKVSPPRR